MNSALFQSVAAPTMAAALDARYISGLKVTNTTFITFKTTAALTCSSTMFDLHTLSHNYKIIEFIISNANLPTIPMHKHCCELLLMCTALINLFAVLTLDCNLE